MFARRSILEAHPRIAYPRRVAKSREAWDVLDRLNAFIGGAGPDVALWLTRLWDDQQRAVTYKELREAIERGFMTQAELDAWQSDYVNFVNSRLRPAWEDAVRAGAASLAAKHPDFFFDPGSQGIRHWMEAHGAEWVTRCTAQQREAIAAMVGLSVSGSWTVDELARAIRPTIGLNRPQAGAALRYYQSMKDSLLKDNPGMRESTAEKRARHAAAVYAQRQHRARAYTIARTELAFAFNKGQDEAVKQAIREGYMGRTEKVWSTAGGNACPVCAALEGTVIEVGGEFDFPGRNLYDGYRETPPAHPNCCCAVEYREIEPPAWRTAGDMGMVSSVPSASETPAPGKPTGQTATDVTDHYIQSATPGRGTITYEDGYRAKGHQDEIAMAEWLHRIFGGDIILLKEANLDKVQTPDYMWHGKLWDLKTVTTEKAADSAIRHGLKQIKENPGGIFLDYRGQEIDLFKLQSIINSRMRHSAANSVDIMVILSDESVKIFRYKK